MKTCSKCGQEKPLGEYMAHRNQCRACMNARRMKWHADHREIALAAMKRRNAAYYAQNPGAYKERAATWSARNKDKRAEIAREYERRQRDQVSRRYVRRMLSQGMKINGADVPQQLVDVTRELVKLKRAINEKL